jgi:hypothetical protein
VDHTCADVCSHAGLQGARDSAEQEVLDEVDAVVFLKSPDTFKRTAERVFASLESPYAETTDGSGITCYQGNALGFRGTLHLSAGELLDPEFSAFAYQLEITSEYGCVDLDTPDLEGMLSELLRAFTCVRGSRRQRAAGGALAPAIMKQTSHRSVEVVRRYIRSGSLFQENAAAYVGCSVWNCPR